MQSNTSIFACPDYRSARQVRSWSSRRSSPWPRCGSSCRGSWYCRRCRAPRGSSDSPRSRTFSPGRSHGAPRRRDRAASAPGRAPWSLDGGPHHDEPREQIKNRGQIHRAALADDELGRVSDPPLIWPLRRDVRSSRLSATGWSWRLIVVTLYRFRARATRRSSYINRITRLRRSPDSCCSTKSSGCGEAIAVLASVERRPHELLQQPILPRQRRFGTPTRGVEPAAGRVHAPVSPLWFRGAAFLLDARGDLKPILTPARTPPDDLHHRTEPSWRRLFDAAAPAYSNVLRDVVKDCAHAISPDRFWLVADDFARPPGWRALTGRPACRVQRVRSVRKPSSRESCNLDVLHWHPTRDSTRTGGLAASTEASGPAGERGGQTTRCRLSRCFSLLSWGQYDSTLYRKTVR